MNLSRRTLLAGAAVLPNLKLAAGAPQSAPGGIKLGVASYSLRKKSLAETVQALKDLKVEYVKFKLEAHLPFSSTDAQIAEAKKMLADAGITLTSTGNNSLAKPDEIKRKFEFNKKLGVPLMIVAPTHATLPEVEKCCREFDMKVAIHNHGPEDKEFPAPADVLKAIRNMDPRVGMCVDIGHSARAGADIVDSVKQAGKRLYDIDAKDLRPASEKWRQVDVGAGSLPIARLFRELMKMKYGGVVHLEYEINENDPVPGMARSFFYMRGVIAGLNA